MSEEVSFLDLYTHFAFGLAVGFVFFGRPDIALLIGLGALLPDLDREYWFIPAAQYRDEQPHRALLHNVFIMALAYLVSPLLSLGVFLHVLQDSFTTVKDRGVEWFYPLTRLVKKGLRDADGNPQPTVPEEKVYFYQEDAKGLTEASDPDLRETGDKPVPWRRVYGFAQNSQILDRGFLFGSAAILLVWLFVPGVAGISTLFSYLSSNWPIWFLGFGSVAILYLAGEMDRRDTTPKLAKFKAVKVPVFAVGLLLLAAWIFDALPIINTNLSSLLGRPVPLLFGVAGVLVASYLAILRKLRKTPAAV